MTPAKLKNFRFDERYAGLLSFFAGRFDVSEAEIIRRALDHVNMEYGLELVLAERFIDQLKERHGENARMDFRLVENGVRTVSAPRHYVPTYLPDEVELLVDGKPDPGLYPQVALGTIEERMAGVERCRIILHPTAGDDKTYVTGAMGRNPKLYIGELDPASPATLSMKVGDLRKEMQVFYWERETRWGVATNGGEGVQEVEPAFDLERYRTARIEAGDLGYMLFVEFAGAAEPPEYRAEAMPRIEEQASSGGRFLVSGPTLGETAEAAVDVLRGIVESGEPWPDGRG